MTAKQHAIRLNIAQVQILQACYLMEYHRRKEIEEALKDVREAELYLRAHGKDDEHE